MTPRTVLAVNPGATSTKVALFAITAGAASDSSPVVELARHAVAHDARDFDPYAPLAAQAPVRTRAIEDFLADHPRDASRLAAVAGRGGLLRPLASGVYAIDDAMLADLARGERGEHASNLGAPMARAIAEPRGIPSFIVDPVCVDELEPVARVTGLAAVERESLSHALNLRATARRVAAARHRPLDALRLVVAHLGTGVSMAAFCKGRMVDVVNPRDEGPLSPDRPGALPNFGLLAWAERERVGAPEARTLLLQRGGFVSHLGTRDLRDALARAAGGDEVARLVLDAFAYQTAKAIGALATVLEGRVDAVVLTGGMAHASEIVNPIVQRVRWIAPVELAPGEDELLALAEGAADVVRGALTAARYA